MILKWGTYPHDQNEIKFRGIHIEEVRSSYGRRYALRHRYVIRGVKRASSQSAMTTKLAALEAAYVGQQGKDLIFYLNDGITETQHKLLTANTLNGTRVESFRYLDGYPGVWGAKTEYVNRRTYEVIISGEVLSAESTLVAWHESLTLIGNGGLTGVIMESLVGVPEIQTTKAFTGCRAIQRGFAMGLQTWPDFPSPLWPARMLGDRIINDIQTPKQWGSTANLMFPISWEYRFIDTSSFSGTPTIP